MASWWSWRRWSGPGPALAGLSIVGMPEVRLVGWRIALPVISMAASALGAQIGLRLLAL
jgi:hypothetical protein